MDPGSTSFDFGEFRVIQSAQETLYLNFATFRSTISVLMKIKQEIYT